MTFTFRSLENIHMQKNLSMTGKILLHDADINHYPTDYVMDRSLSRDIS